jgi:hypothetical protein
MSIEQAVRDAAAALSVAIIAAREAGYFVQWPSSPDGLAGIAISETRKAGLTVQVNTPGVAADVTERAREAAQKAADGVFAEAVASVERSAETLRGEPLNLTEAERAALPALDPNASNDPSTFVTGTAGDPSNVSADVDTDQQTGKRRRS